MHEITLDHRLSICAPVIPYTFGIWIIIKKKLAVVSIRWQKISELQRGHLKIFFVNFYNEKTVMRTVLF